MYETYYNLVTAPFNNTPNPRFFFETEQHKEALAKLEYTVRNKRGFALITGEIGSGKTTLTRTLIRRLGHDARVALVNNTRVSSSQLLRLIAAEFQIDAPHGSAAASSSGEAHLHGDKAVMVTALRRFVEHQHQVGRNVVLIIDEGQCLSIDEFEEIRLLTNLENETEKLVQLLILGQPELRATLGHPRLAPLIQRIAMYMHLGPMSFDDTTRYIAFRLVRASNGRPNVDFSREALRLIYEQSHGVPRVVNLVCDNALLVGYSLDTRLIDSHVVRRAVTQMMPNFGGQTADIFEQSPQSYGDGAPADGADVAAKELDDGRRL